MGNETTSFCLLIFLQVGCETEGLQWGDGGAYGTRAQDAADVLVAASDAAVAVDVQESDRQDVDLLADSRTPVDIGVEMSADVADVADVAEVGREVSSPEAGPELQVSPDLRPVLPEVGPEAKKCAPECNTGCNVGCREDGQCQACATCTCEVASGTCHC
jgi:hypothetical protein